MGEFISTIISKFKIKEIVAILFFSSFIFTVLPNEVLKNLALLEFRNNYKTIISLILILTISYYLFNIMKFLSVLIIRFFFPIHKRGIKYMKKDISPDEMSLIINTFYNKENNSFLSTGYITISDGRKAALENKKIIYLSSQISEWDSFAYNLQPYARKYLNKNLKNGNIKIENDKISYLLK